MIAVILGSGIVFLDTSVVNLALKAIGEDLPHSLVGKLEGQSYVSNGYFLSLAALLILAGALADYHGRRRVFGLGLIGFGVTSLLCGVAWSLEWLAVFRVLQGAAGALLVPGSLAIITSSFAGEDQGRAFGIWAGASAATTILGPLVGGLLVNSISWRAAFLINLPFVLLAYFATRRYVPESRNRDASAEFDWIGSLIVILAVGGLAFGTIRGQQLQWRDGWSFVSLAVGAAATLLLPFYMSRRKNPLVPLDLFRSRNFSVTNLSTFVIYGALYVVFFFMSVFLIGTLGYTEPAAGLAGIPGTVFLALFSTRFGKLAARYGPRLFMAVGPAIMGLGILWLARMPADSTPWRVGVEGGSLVPPADYLIDLVPAMVVFGIGLMIMVAPLTTALMTSVPAERSGVGSAINNAISRVGAPLVGAVIFVAVASSFYGAVAEQAPGVDTSSRAFRADVAPLNPPPPEAGPGLALAIRESSTRAFHLSILVAAAMMFTGAAVNAFGIRNVKTSAQEPVPEPTIAPPPAAPADPEEAKARTPAPAPPEAPL